MNTLVSPLPARCIMPEKAGDEKKPDPGHITEVSGSVANLVRGLRIREILQIFFN
jgi:hypothetical protein